MDRRWPAWAGLWAAWAQALLWLMCVPEALDVVERPRVGPDVDSVGTVTATVIPILGVVLIGCFLFGIGAWGRSSWLLRPVLVVSGAGLLASAVAWAFVPSTGPVYVLATATAAALAFLGAWLPDGAAAEPAVSRGGWVARAATALAGLVLLAGGLRGMAYWQWQITSGELSFLLAVALGLTMLGVAVAAPALAGRQRVLRWVAAIVLLVCALPPLAFGILWLGEVGTLRMHEEAEVAWAYATPAVALGGGLLAAGVAARRCWWQLAGLTAASGVLLCVVAVLRETTIRHLV